MPSRVIFVPAVLAILVVTPALAAQRVMITGASPSAVIVAMHKRLSSQGFRLEDSSKKQAQFALDRGMVSQTSGSGLVRSVPVILELHVRFKEKGDSLQVDAYEEAVGDRGNHQFEFRKRVQSPAEVSSMQQLLEAVKAELEASP